MSIENIPVDQLGLSMRASNVLRRAGKHTLGAVMECSEEELKGLHNCGIKTAEEIMEKIAECRRRLDSGEFAEREAEKPLVESAPVIDYTDLPLEQLILLPDLQKVALQYAQNHDKPLESLGFSNKVLNLLRKNSFSSLSSILFLTASELARIPAAGTTSVRNFLECRNAWLKANEAGLRAAFAGDESALRPPQPEDAVIRSMILQLYAELPYAGLSLQEFAEKLPDNTDAVQIKRCVGSLLAEKKLEYVDFRCYRVYPPFAECLAACGKVSERNRQLIADHLHGTTLEAVGSAYDLTRERVRQITKDSVKTVRSALEAETGSGIFYEDYYRYFYQTYQFEKKDAAKWFGLSAAALRYLDLIEKKRGNGSLEDAQEDPQLSPGLRQRIRNYLNRDKLYLDGRWFPKKRAELERYVVEHFCRENVSFSDFVERYNAFLLEQGIPYDENIYCTDTSERAVQARLSKERYLLWSQGATLRAYDVDGRDYSDLLSGLDLDELENIELSTQKFIDDYPELMEQYDIRDRYELHNLLRKILPDGSYHSFKLGKMPTISFGSFDRDAALLELMRNNAPISQAELIDMIRKEYGYDESTIIMNYLPPLSVYYHQGTYSVSQKEMSAEHRTALLDALEGDFYYIDELRQIYTRVIPGADKEEVNPENLKRMGFHVLSRYAFRNHDTLEAFFQDLLTRKDLLDIAELRRRYANVAAFSAVLNSLKRALTVVEYEPNRLISMGKLNAAGVFRSDIEDFCNAVYNHVEKDTYFTAKSLRLSGFQIELYELGFSDWFYGSLLLSDPRFSYGNLYKANVYCKGKAEVTVRSFETALVRNAGSIDVYDLQREMEEIYGCSVPDRLDLVYRVADGVYYDKHLDRLYDSESRFWQEVDETEGR